MPMGDSEMAASDEGSKMPAAEETTETQEMMSTTEKSRRKMKSRSVSTKRNQKNTSSCYLISGGETTRKSRRSKLSITLR